MKRRPFVIFLAILFSMTACTPTPAPSDPPEGTPLTAEELAWFNDHFFSGEGSQLRNAFLYSTYTSPKEIDLFYLFYDGTGDDAAPSQEEIDAVQAQAGTAVPLTVTKLTRDGMDAALRQYTGSSLVDTEQNGLENFIWLERYSAYYNVHGDTTQDIYTMASGTQYEDGTVSLYYETGGGDNRIVTLLKTEDGYLFRSNLPAG